MTLASAALVVGILGLVTTVAVLGVAVREGHPQSQSEQKSSARGHASAMALASTTPAQGTLSGEPGAAESAYLAGVRNLMQGRASALGNPTDMQLLQLGKWACQTLRGGGVPNEFAELAKSNVDPDNVSREAIGTLAAIVSVVAGQDLCPDAGSR